MERRSLTRSQIDAQYVGATRIAPGLWEDAEGNLHWSIPELLALVDLPDTAELREQVAEMVHDMLEAHGCPQIVRQDAKLE